MNEIIEILLRLEEALPGKEIMFYLSHLQPAFRVRWMKSGGGVQEIRVVFTVKEIRGFAGNVPDMLVREIIRRTVSSYSLDRDGNQP